MAIQLSDHFNYKKLFLYTIPSIMTMILTSIYSIVDGLFVSNYVGKTPFAALNLIYPFIMAISTVGFMMGTGGSAIVGIALGEGKKKKANEYFSMIIYVTAIVSIVISIIAMIFMKDIAYFLGASEQMIHDCVLYGRIIAGGLTAFILQVVFQSFCITAQKPSLNFKLSITSGLTNIVLDYLFVAVFQWGIAGAAFATIIGQTVGAVFPLIYFYRENDSLLQLTKTNFEGRVLLKVCINGSSELMTNISASLVNILYNFQLMSLAGENGVAAYGVIMYVSFIFSAVYIGYSIGSAPIFSYHFGAKNDGELKNLVKKSLLIIGTVGLFMTTLAEIMAPFLVRIFVGYDQDLFKMTCYGFQLYSFSFLVMGFNIWSSGFFTALGDGVTSAILAFLRTLVFQVIVIYTLPYLLGIDGIWLAVVVAEVMALFVTIYFLLSKKNHFLVGSIE
jgi:putative efflux protein, MATE family